jgi:hypothetical protein
VGHVEAPISYSPNIWSLVVIFVSRLSGSTGDSLKKWIRVGPGRDQVSPSRSPENLGFRAPLVVGIIQWDREKHCGSVRTVRILTSPSTAWKVIAVLHSAEKSAVSAETPSGFLHATDYGVECTHCGRSEREEE